MQFSRISMLEETSSSSGLIIINIVYPFFYGVIGTLLNLILIIGLIKRKNKTYQKYTLPIGSAILQLNLIVFVISNTRFNSSSRLLINYSTLTCKTFTFILHVTSSCTTWVFSMCLFVVKCYLNKNLKCLERIHFVYFLLILKLCLIYSVDLFYVDLNTIESNGNQTQEIKICSIKDMRFLYIRDVVDFLFYFLLPFLILTYNIVQMRPFQKLKLYPRMRGLFHSVFLFFFAPNVCVILVKDFLIVTNNETINTNIVLEWLFTVAIMINNSFIIGAILLHAYFNVNTRVICYKIFCFPCFLLSILNEIRKLEKNMDKSYSLV